MGDGGWMIDPDDQEKDRLIQELREAVRARDEFVAIAAHELRNPMTPILMQVQVLLRAARSPRGCDPNALLPRLEMLEAAVQEFIRRSMVLLETSRIAVGNVRVDPTDVDATRLVRRVVERAGFPARLARCSVRTKLQEGVRGHWDELALEQIAENLLSNAIKFGAGKPVFVGLCRKAGTAQLVVRDRGVGISAEDRARIFGRFERAVTQRGHGGFGVGLWLTQRLVSAMGGAISVESVPGKGSRFIVTLPVGQQRENG